MIQISVSLASLLTLVSVACATSNSELTRALLIPTALTCLDCRLVTVARTIDGDTLDSSEGRIRLFGVDTPERGEQCYAEAKDRLTTLAGSTSRVEAGPRAMGPYGRRLLYVYTVAGQNVEAILIREGLGRAWTRDGQHRDYLMALEESAMEKRAGCLWGK